MASYEGEAIEPASLDYQVYVWRRKMGITPQEAAAVPYSRIVRDLQYLDIEAQVLKAKQPRSGK
jgi:hypothetical protein